MFKKLLFFLLFVLWAFASCQNRESGPSSSMSSSPAVGTKGMVSSAHSIATQAGIDLLKQGGNAFDAAVGIAAALNVVEPQNSGIGGYGTILIYNAKKEKTLFLDSSGKIPFNVDSDVFRPPNPDYRQNRRGAKAVSTPGNVKAWWAMSSENGKLDWKSLFEKAIRIAEEGFEVDERLAHVIDSSFGSFNQYARGVYGKNDSPLKKGDVLVQKDLGRSLRLIADKGADIVYKGELGKAIDTTMRRSDGFLTLEDLKAHRAELWEPVSIDYRGYTVITASPPSTAFPSLIRLGLMSQFDNASLGHNSPAFLHRFAEVTKHAFWCRLAFAGDPEINPPPLFRLLSEEYWKEVVEEKIDLERSKPFSPPNVVVKRERHTTHFVVADKWGNIISATQTLGGSFGSRILVEGTGIWLNNSLAYCTFEPKGNPMDAVPGQRKLSGDCPTLVLKHKRPWIAIGTPGGHTIGQTVPQIIMNIIDFGMDIQEALAAPRISFVEPDMIIIERGIDASVRNALKAMGHKIRVVDGIGNAHGLTIEYDSEDKKLRFKGAADPRGSGMALGF